MQMKVILNQDIPSLGEEGDVVSVAGGYARNYLIPNQLAVVHSKVSIASFESRRKAIEKRKEEKLNQAKSLKEKIESLSLSIPMPAGESGRLFGSVGNANIAEELEKQGISVERKRIDVQAHAIKMVGKYPVSIKLYGGETAQMTIEVTGVATGQKAVAKETEAAPKKKAAEKEAPEDETAAADTSDTEAPVDAPDEQPAADTESLSAESEANEDTSPDEE